MAAVAGIEAECLKPPLKWAGGKRWQVPHLRELWEPYANRRFVEPFCGGLAATLGLRPIRALLNDANPHLINFYGRVKDGLRIRVKTANDKHAFYGHRERFNSLLRSGKGNTDQAAELFYYLNRTGYNGLCRFNSRGEFNVPFGRYKTITYAKSFPDLRTALAGWEFTAGDFEAVALQPGDFVYADPPYDVEFTSYAQGGFSWADQQRTASFLARHAGPVVLVNQATPRIEALYRSLEYSIRFLDAPRRISCNGDRTPAREILATRNL
jgi:DNA adenine methylase